MGEATNIIIGLIVISGIIIGISAFVGDIYSNYGVSSADLSYLNKTAEINEQVTGLKDAIESTQITGTIADVPLTFAAGALAALKLLLNVPNIMITMLVESGQVIGIPSWAIIMGSAIVVVIMLFVILRAILNWDV